MSGQTDRQLLAVVRSGLRSAEQHDPSEVEVSLAALVELEARADERERLGAEWPLPVFDAAVARFGPQINNRKSQTRKGLNRKVEHAMRTWDDNYGPLNPEQAEYAATCLASRFRPELELPQIYVRLDSIVHDPIVHAGFLQRAG